MSSGRGFPLKPNAGAEDSAQAAGGWFCPLSLLFPPLAHPRLPCCTASRAVYKVAPGGNHEGNHPEVAPCDSRRSAGVWSRHVRSRAECGPAGLERWRARCAARSPTKRGPRSERRADDRGAREIAARPPAFATPEAREGPQSAACRAAPPSSSPPSAAIGTPRTCPQRRPLYWLDGACTMSFFKLVTSASTSSFSFLRNLNLSSVSTRCTAAAFQCFLLYEKF